MFRDMVLPHVASMFVFAFSFIFTLSFFCFKSSWVIMSLAQTNNCEAESTHMPMGYSRETKSNARLCLASSLLFSSHDNSLFPFKPTEKFLDPNPLMWLKT